jgi:Uncharacterized conserved protein
MQFDPSRVLVLAGRARGLGEALNKLPMLPALTDELEQELVELSIHATAAIAGNPMRLDEVRELLALDYAQADVPAGPTVARARREITNLGLAYAPLPKRRTEAGVFGVSEGFMRKVHAVMVQGTVSGGMGEYAKEVQNRVLDLITRTNAQDLYDLEQAVRAGIFHYHLFRLRPFNEGNGRVARFFESSILAVGGFRYACMMLPMYYRRHTDEYLRFFPLDGSPAEDADLTSFLVFMLEGLLESLETLRERLSAPLRRLALIEHFRLLLEAREINKRSHDLLVLLLDRETVPDAERKTGLGAESPGLQGAGTPLPFQLKDLFLKTPYKLLYDKVSEHTARRDLNRLLELGLLAKEGTSYTFQNRCLG